jgi:hypothetical protein
LLSFASLELPDLAEGIDVGFDGDLLLSKRRCPNVELKLGSLGSIQRVKGSAPDLQFPLLFYSPLQTNLAYRRRQ